MAFPTFTLGKYSRISALTVVSLLGLYTRFNSGPSAVWVNHYLGGVFYVIFWCLLVTVIWPNLNPLKIVISVLLASSMVECLQLWNPPYLAAIRRSIPGQILLGSSFDPADFVYYLIGSGISLILLRARRRTTP
jgi:hypothetical protein